MAIRTLRNLFQAVFLLAALLATSLLFAVLTMHFAIHGAEVHVPALRGMTLEQARSQTAGLDLNLAVDHDYYSTDIPAGRIVSQSPPPGTVVRREWQVRVAQSLGPQRVQVPDVLGMQQRTAILALRNSGLQTATAAELPDTAVAQGTVLAQDPPAHAQDIEQPSIHLLVAVPDTSEANGFLMPDLRGLSLSNIRVQLTRVGIRLAPVRFEQASIPQVAAVSDTGTRLAPVAPVTLPGTILLQQPAAGSRIAVGDSVQLTVAR